MKPISPPLMKGMAWTTISGGPSGARLAVPSAALTGHAPTIFSEELPMPLWGTTIDENPARCAPKGHQGGIFRGVVHAPGRTTRDENPHIPRSEPLAGEASGELTPLFSEESAMPFRAPPPMKTAFHHLWWSGRGQACRARSASPSGPLAPTPTHVASGFSQEFTMLASSTTPMKNDPCAPPSASVALSAHCVVGARFIAPVSSRALSPSPSGPISQEEN